MDPPAGVEIREGLHYNPYFAGGAIAMSRVLYDDLIEYDDGNPFLSLKELVCRLFVTHHLIRLKRNTGHDVSNGQGRVDLFGLGGRARAR